MNQHDAFRQIGYSYIQMLQRAQEFSSTIYAGDMDEMQQHLEQSNAFLESTEAKLKIISGR